MSSPFQLQPCGPFHSLKKVSDAVSSVVSKSRGKSFRSVSLSESHSHVVFDLPAVALFSAHSKSITQYHFACLALEKVFVPFLSLMNYFEKSYFSFALKSLVSVNQLNYFQLCFRAHYSIYFQSLKLKLKVFHYLLNSQSHPVFFSVPAFSVGKYVKEVGV